VGWDPRNASIGVGEAVLGPEDVRARKNSKNSAPVRVGKDGVEWPMMSVWMCSPRWK